MTKEEILKKIEDRELAYRIANGSFFMNDEDIALSAMQEYADQEVKRDLRDKNELQKAIAQGQALIDSVRSFLSKEYPDGGEWLKREIEKLLSRGSVR